MHESPLPADTRPHRCERRADRRSARPLLPSACLALLLLLLAACGGERRPLAPAADLLETVQRRGELRVGVKADAPPFSDRVGSTYVGFDIDVAHAVAGELGVARIRFVPVTSNERIGALLRGEVDMVVASMTITRTREELVDFSIPYFEDGQMLLVSGGSAIGDYTDLAGKRVAVLAGTTSERNMRQVAPSAELVTVPSYEAAVARLRAGEVDAVTSDGLILLGLKLAAGQDELAVVGRRFSSEPYGIAVPEDQSDFRDAVDAALQSLWESGAWQDIYRTWFGPGARYETSIDFAMAPYPE